MRMSYDRFFLTIKRDEKPLPNMEDYLKMLRDVQLLAAEIEMDLDGSMGRSKEDLSRVPKLTRSFLGDMSDQVLQSLEVMTVPLPSKKLQPKETWKAQRNFMVGNAFFVVPASVDIVYTYIGVQKEKGLPNGRDCAVIGIEGDVRPRRGSGDPDIGGTLRCLAYVALDTGEVIQANANVKAELDIGTGKTASKVIATMGVNILRRAGAHSCEEGGAHDRSEGRFTEDRSGWEEQSHAHRRRLTRSGQRRGSRRRRLASRH